MPPERLSLPMPWLRGLLLLSVLSLSACWWDDERRPSAAGPGTDVPAAPEPGMPDADLAVVVPAPAYWPTADWAPAAPESHGFVAGAFDALATEALAEIPFHTSLLVIKDGYLVHESYRDEEEAPAWEETPEEQFVRLRDQQRHVWSISKSVTAMTVGVALTRGDIASLDQSVGGLFAAAETGLAADDARLAITLRHALQMRSGLEWNEDAWLLSFERDPLFTAFGKPACAAAPDRLFCSILQQPGTYAPGSTWSYSTYDSYIAAALFARLTGGSLHDYAMAHLFSVLGIAPEATAWTTLAPLANTTFGGGLLNIRSRDLAKLGLLMLHNGQWEGESIIAAPVMQAMLATQGEGVQAAFGSDGSLLDTPEPAFIGYGLQWWRRTGTLSAGEPAVLARGLHGQRLYILREHNLVVVLTSDAASADAEARALRYAAIDAFVRSRIIGRLAPAAP